MCGENSKCIPVPSQNRMLTNYKNTLEISRVINEWFNQGEYINTLLLFFLCLCEDLNHLKHAQPLRVGHSGLKF